MAAAGAVRSSGSGSSSSSFCDRHARLLLAQINRLRAGQSFCDVRLEVGPEAFAVHRLVLAASSPYFAALLAGGMKESGRDVVRIAGVEADIFGTLLDFIYTGNGGDGTGWDGAAEGDGAASRRGSSPPTRPHSGAPAPCACPQGW